MYLEIEKMMAKLQSDQKHIEQVLTQIDPLPHKFNMKEDIQKILFHPNIKYDHSSESRWYKK